MVENDLVSIIIPTYNRANTLQQVLTCLINQTYENIEIIIVDHYSNDGTNVLVNDFISKDKRIRLLQSPNKGALAQRSYGVLNANGRYIQFVDSDDFVSEKFVEIPLKYIQQNNADVVTFKSTDDKRFLTSYECISIYTGKKLRKLLNNIENSDLGLSCWSKIVKKEIAVEACNKYYNNTCTSIKLWEDSIFSYAVYCLSKKIVKTNEKLYFYNQNNANSSVRIINDYLSAFNETLLLKSKLYSILESTHFNKYQSSIYLLYQFEFLFNSNNLHSFKVFVKFIKEINNEYSLFKYFKKLSIKQAKCSTTEKLLIFALRIRSYFLLYLIGKRLLKQGQVK